MPLPRVEIWYESAKDTQSISHGIGQYLKLRKRCQGPRTHLLVVVSAERLLKRLYSRWVNLNRPQIE